MAWSGLFLFGANEAFCMLDLVSLLWGLGYILPHGGLLILLGFLFFPGDPPGGSSLHIWCSRFLVVLLISLCRSLIFILWGKGLGVSHCMMNCIGWRENTRRFGGMGKPATTLSRAVKRFVGFEFLFCLTLYPCCLSDFSAQVFPLVSNFKLLLSFHFLIHLPVSVL